MAGRSSSPAGPLPIDPLHWQQFWRGYYTSFRPTGTLHGFVDSLVKKHYPEHHAFLRANRHAAAHERDASGRLSAACQRKQQQQQQQQAQAAGLPLGATAARPQHAAEASSRATLDTHGSGLPASSAHGPAGLHSMLAPPTCTPGLSGINTLAAHGTGQSSVAAPARTQSGAGGSSPIAAGSKALLAADRHAAATHAASGLWAVKEADGEAAANVAWRRHVARGEILWLPEARETPSRGTAAPINARRVLHRA